MSGICAGRVVIVTGAGRGLGREYALAFAREGAKVVVNDLGTTLTGEGRDTATAQAVVDEIRAAGGEAVANGDDVADWDGAGRLVRTAVEAFGRLDAVVNNAGFVRDRMFVSQTVEEWDAVIRVHLRGHFCVTSHAVAHWRAENKAGRPVDARIINTSSGAGLQGSLSQSVYSAAKGGIASLTLVQAAELGRYGITARGARVPGRERRRRACAQAHGDAARPRRRSLALHRGARLDRHRAARVRGRQRPRHGRARAAARGAGPRPLRRAVPRVGGLRRVDAARGAALRGARRAAGAHRRRVGHRRARRHRRLRRRRHGRHRRGAGRRAVGPRALRARVVRAQRSGRRPVRGGRARPARRAQRLGGGRDRRQGPRAGGRHADGDGPDAALRAARLRRRGAQRGRGRRAGRRDRTGCGLLWQRLRRALRKAPP
ncbi:MAG: SDR family NAD(P)-dependent oxidoreductase [Gammaproteobacteria bacterium]|nr:SDR family NAD(P)-dependent oxidoreductase [Gammaproteobacteria bacterium]